MKRKKLYATICCIALVLATMSGVLYMKYSKSNSVDNKPKVIENKFDKVIESKVSSDDHRLLGVIISNIKGLNISQDDIGKRRLVFVAVEGQDKDKNGASYEVVKIPSGKSTEDVLGKYEIVTDKPIIRDVYQGNHLTLEIPMTDVEKLISLKSSSKVVVKILYQE